MLLNNQQIVEEIKICIEMNENKNTNTWRLNNTLLDNKQIMEEIKKEI